MKDFKPAAVIIIGLILLGEFLIQAVPVITAHDKEAKERIIKEMREQGRVPLGPSILGPAQTKWSH